MLSAPAPIDEQRVEGLGVDARGLYALEYLLFDPRSANAMALANDPHGARARAYALELAANVRGYADRVQRLLGDGHDYAKSFANGAPGGGPVNFENAEAASQYLITEQSICTVPWDDAGPFLRFSATYEAADEKAEDALMVETEARLKNIQPVF